MAFRAINEEIVVINFDTAPAAAQARDVPFFKAPRAMTITYAYAALNTNIGTANTTSFYALSLLNGGTVGTSTLTMCTFGSAATPYTWTLSQGYTGTWGTTSRKDLASGEWVLVREECTSTIDTGLATVCVHAVHGTGRVS